MNTPTILHQANYRTPANMEPFAMATCGHGLHIWELFGIDDWSAICIMEAS
jgi:hypothetical protein